MSDTHADRQTHSCMIDKVMYSFHTVYRFPFFQIDIPLGIRSPPSVDGRHVILALLPVCPRGTGLADGIRRPSCSIEGIMLVLLRRCRSAPRDAEGHKYHE